MPRVKITSRCIVKATANVNVTYEPADDVLAPDAHIDEIVARGCGVRLTQRGDLAAGDPASSGGGTPEQGAQQNSQQDAQQETPAP